MIHVEPQPEPPDFDGRVRQPGKRASGLRSALWRRSLRHLWEAYGGVCAYSSIRIPWLTGSATVDHFVPKSRRPDLAYEWKNFRLACSRMNARKGEAVDVLDPFKVRDGWFTLQLQSLEVLPSPDLSPGKRRQVQATIDRLGLNDGESKAERAGYYDDYLANLKDARAFDRLRKWSPFVAKELVRQGFVTAEP